MCAESSKMFSWPGLGCGDDKFQRELCSQENLGGAKPDRLACQQGGRLRLIQVAL
jgi:hypothetical protein